MRTMIGPDREHIRRIKEQVRSHKQKSHPASANGGKDLPEISPWSVAYVAMN